MDKKDDKPADKQNLQITLDPTKVPVLYTDTVLVSSTDNGLVLDVAQSVGGNQAQLAVVTRVGMSAEHAKNLVTVLNDHLQKFER